MFLFCGVKRETGRVGVKYEDWDTLLSVLEPAERLREISVGWVPLQGPILRSARPLFLKGSLLRRTHPPSNQCDSPSLAVLHQRSSPGNTALALANCTSFIFLLKYL